MKLPGADPADALKKISEELKTKFDEAGMGKVDEFVDTLDEIKAMVEKGPAAIMDEMKGLFDAFKGKLQEVLDNPSTLAPAGGMAGCAAWYGGAVAGKLGALNDEAQEMLEAIKGLVGQIQEPMKKLGDVLEKAMKELEGTIKKLAKMPAELTNLSGSVKGAEDVAKIDTSPMKKCLDVSGISSPLDALGALKEPLKDAMAAVTAGVNKLVEFLGAVPDKVRDAFNVPTPLCFLQSVLLSQAPEAMTKLLEMVEGMKKLDLQPMQDGLAKVGNTICDLDPAMVTEPVKKFAASAKDSVDNLDKIVSGAKMASGGGAGGMMGKLMGK